MQTHSAKTAPQPTTEQPTTEQPTTEKKYDIAAFTAADVAELASRLERDEYTNAFAGLEDWHLLRSIAFQRPELVEPYLYLLDMEAYDEA
ncbi:protein IsiD [Trichothermofontia sp.]